MSYQLNSTDEPDRPPNSYNVTRWDIFALIYSIFIHIVDVGLDIYLVCSYYNHGQYSYFILTVIFLTVPAVITTIMSLTMYIVDGVPTVKSCRRSQYWCIPILLLLQAPLLRYWDSLHFALKSRKAREEGNQKDQKKYYMKMLDEDCDAALLRVFKCYLEAAPQQVLQITILLVDFSQGETFFIVQQVLSISSSFLAMAWCIASYNRAIRFPQLNKKNITWCGTGVQLLWHLCVTVSRILCMAIMSTAFAITTSVATAFHWLIVSVWLMYLGNTRFCGETSGCPLNSLFCLALGLVYIFNYISVHEGPSRYNYIIYYTICFCENIAGVVMASIVAFNDFGQKWYFYPLIIVPHIIFLLGMIFLTLYYKYFHPQSVRTTITDGIVNSKQSFLRKAIPRDIHPKVDRNNEHQNVRLNPVS